MSTHQDLQARLASNSIALAPRVRLDGPLGVGLGALIGAAVLTVATSANPVTILLAAVATAALSRVARLGPIPAALAVLLAIPYGRGADVTPFMLAGFPVRPADAAIAVGVVLALWRLRRIPRPGRGLVLVLACFLAVGIGATALGWLRDNTIRDIVRDVRWWGLYAGLGLAILTRVRPSEVLRGLLLGTALFAIVAVCAAVLPVFHGGLKDQVLTYDRGTLRMQFGNSVFLLPAIALVAHRAVRRPSIAAVAWLTLLLAAQVLSLTRTSLLVTLGMVGLVVVVDILVMRAAPVRRLAMALATIAVSIALSFAAGLGIAVAGVLVTGVQPATATPGSPPSQGESVLDRITFQSDESDLASTLSSAGGRMTTYANAVDAIRTSPIVGLGMGSLVNVPFAYNDSRAYTHGKQPGVDNAYLTIGLKSGVVGILAFAALMLAPLLLGVRNRGVAAWFIPAWLAVLALTMTQSFAVSTYGPFGVSLLALVAIPGYAASIGRTASSQR